MTELTNYVPTAAHADAYATIIRQASVRRRLIKASTDIAELGYDEVLFLNERGEVTEGAIGNIFIEKDGRLLTPPVDSGVLPGVYRRHLLQTRSNAEERVLLPGDLRNADTVYICNAVRGLRKVEIIR